MATIRVKNPNLGGEKWITIPTKILSEADHIVTNKGQGDLYLSNDGTYKDVIKSANDYTDKLIELITGSSPDILETLKELSNQTSDNKDFINVLNKSIATKLDKTANAVSASKLATPIKLWGNDFDGSLSVYGNLCAPNGNLGLGINANNVVLGNNTNPSYIYGSSVMFKTGTDAVAAYISSDGKIGIGTANPLVGFHVNVNSYFDYPIKVSGTVDHSSPLLKLDATNTNNNGLLVLSKLGNSKAAIGIDDTQGMWFLNLSNSNIFRITSNSLTYGSNKIWHEGNFNPSDYLPLSGGIINAKEKSPLKITGGNYGEISIGIFKDGNEMSVFGYTETLGTFMWDNVSHSRLYIRNNKLFFTPSAYAAAETIWHSGNDGEDSGLDADMLDGLHSGNFAKSLMDVGANNTKSNVLGYTYGTEAHGGASAGGLISAGMGTYGMQLNGAYNGNKLSFRGFSPDGYTDWKTIAFTDSDITGNSAGAQFLRGPELEANSDLNLLHDYSGIRFWKKLPPSTNNVPAISNWANSLLQIPLHGTSSLSALLYFSHDRPLYYRSNQKSNWKELTTSDGYYKDMRVGLADDLGGMEEKVEEEYIIQPTANTNEIRDGYAHIDSLKGNSIVWNLLFDGSIRTSGTSNNVLLNGKYICTPTGTPGTPGSSAWSSGWSKLLSKVIPGKYIVLLTYTRLSKRTDVEDFTPADVRIAFTYTDLEYCFPINIGETKLITAIILTSGSGLEENNMSITLNDCIVEISNVSIVNITKMFGAGNEPETVEEFYARVPQGVDLYTYNEGEIINFTADSIKSVGFNQWDEEWEVGLINSSNGLVTPAENSIRSKNFCCCLPNTDYYLRCGSYTNRYYLAILWYDDLFGFIKGEYNSANIAKSPENAKYFKIITNNGTYIYGNTYNNDICINISDPGKNGTYEPYKEFVRQLPTNLFENGMKSAGDVYDEIYWDKNKKKYIKVTRVGSVDLGSLNWIINSDGPRFMAMAIRNIKTIASWNKLGILQYRYQLDSPNSSDSPDKTLGVYSGNIYIIDRQYADAASFKQAMQGVILHYELAEPIIEELDIPYMDYEVSNDGTERIESDTSSTPIKASVVYNFDAINTIKQNRYDVSDLKKGATKLATPVKLWGNDFDGSNDVNGDISLGGKKIYWHVDPEHYYIGTSYIMSSQSTNLDYEAAAGHRFLSFNKELLRITASGYVGIGTTNPQFKLDVNGDTYSNNIVLGTLGWITSSLTDTFNDSTGRNRPWYGLSFDVEKSSAERTILASYHGMLFKYGGNKISVFDGGNVGIGTYDPQYKLDVNGSIRFSDSLYTERPFSMFTKNDNGEYSSILSVNSTGDLTVGYGTSEVGEFTNIDGNSVHLRYGTAHTKGMILNSSGNITIGDSDLAKDQYSLRIKGKTYIGEHTPGDDQASYLNINQYIADLYWAIHVKNSYIYENSLSPGVGIKLALGANNESYKWIGIAAVSESTYSNNVGLSIINNNTNDGSHELMRIDSKGNVFPKHNVASLTLGTPDNSWHTVYATLLVSSPKEYGIYMKGRGIMIHDNNNSWIANSMYFGNSGNVDFLDFVTIKNYLTVNGQIKSGELVDWYGVSWSENDSDPTCTRIGNMALHRSLPIQSAMKGYYIDYSSTEYYNEQIVPLSNDWTKIKYDLRTNNNPVIDTYYLGNTMVKIPEFWYIDDYEPETKTHNLKISQTAKAGWIHHKEAYVGAYEGYSNDIRYRSTKNVTPTVSASRTTLRSLARANGYEDEYKWNIYTYEEHRAICHLFLVEYATRNSQLAVNTALTKDGFKQGGLGSGCTTGAVTINGQTTYSFIPTGTTDSLGNGSGQVAYTVTQTDADGNEIGTVTRYANRYRGIENPFGHIWKHVDDIVNVYNAETTYKTVYKCNKPEHFATNKNAKYKPLCSFPGGSKMQGYSKEIKATINCDFFKYSVGGSGSTYWYDYNYDNDDISEHCLLIGGSSGHGGDAGLFSLHLADGVGNSHATVGSRLTYLPWAE